MYWHDNMSKPLLKGMFKIVYSRWPNSVFYIFPIEYIIFVLFHCSIFHMADTCICSWTLNIIYHMRVFKRYEEEHQIFFIKLMHAA